MIEDDINEIGEDFIQAPKKGRKQWKPLFHPKSYWSEHQYHDLDDNKLGKRALKSYGRDIGEKRQLFTDRALAVSEMNSKAMNDGLNSAAELGKKLQNRGTGVKKDPYDIQPKEYIEPTDIVCRKKGKGRPKLTVREKIKIVHKVICEHHSEKEVAKEHRISQQYVSYLCMKTRKNPKFLTEMASENQKKAAVRVDVLQVIMDYFNNERHVGSTRELKSMLKEEHGIDIKPWTLRQYLRKELNLRYKRIEDTSWKGNAPKNLILRQHFAIGFLRLDLTKKTIVSCDESWLGMSDFRRMKWSPVGRPNSVAKK